VRRHYGYPARAAAAAYARGATGLALTLLPLWALQPARAVAWALAAGAALFLVYFVRAVVRHLTQIELDETGISAKGPLGAVIRWDELRSVRLSYYTTRSDRTGGWMQLDLRGARRRIAVDSSLGGFAELAGAAAREAERHGRAIDEATRANLAALGVALARDA
jgi:hypothetical protein